MYGCYLNDVHDLLRDFFTPISKVKVHSHLSRQSGSSNSSKFYFQQNKTMEQYQEKNVVDISKHIETLLHLSMVSREAPGLIKLASGGLFILTF